MIRSRHALSFSVVMLTVAFIAAVMILYMNYLVPVWGYQGFYEFSPSKSSASLGCAVMYILGFAFAYPPVINRYSRFVVWILFFYLYVPSSVIVSMQGIPDDGGIMLVTCLAISFWIISFLPEIFVRSKSSNYRPATNLASQLGPNETNNHIIRSKYYVPVIVFSSLFFIVIFIYYFQIVNFVSLLDVYGQREIAADYAPNRSIMAYALQWEFRLISPFLIAIGLIFRKKLPIIIGIAGFLLCFSIIGSKSTIFVFLLMLFLYRFVLSNNYFSAFQVGVFLFVCLSIPLFVVLIAGNEINPLVDLTLSQILKRAFAVGGMTLGHYFDFFSHNPNTYFSHLGPVSWFINYPYGNFSVGQVLGNFQAGTYNYNMSANFWAIDGIASAGYVGIIVVGVVLGIILTMFNRWSKPKHFVLLCLSSLNCVWMLADSSLFPVLISGGWPFHFLLVYWYYSGICSSNTIYSNKVSVCTK